MSSSDDDAPLSGKASGHISAATIPKSVDRAMDKATSKKDLAPAGISVRNGPVNGDMMGVDEVVTNGKRKSRGSAAHMSYKEQESDEEDEPKPQSKRQRRKPQDDDSDSDNEPIAKRRTSKLPPAVSQDDSDDEPLTKLAATKANIEKKAEKEAKAIRAKESQAAKRKSTGATPASASAKKKNGVKEESDSDEPLSKAASKAAAKATPLRKVKAKKEESDSDVPLAKKASAKKTSAKGKAVKKEETEEPDEGEEGEEEFRWWDAPKKEDDSIKWTTLEHNGVIFPPEYEPLPSHVKLHYNGVPVNVQKEAEEVAGFFGAMLNSTHNVENPTFQKNFFNDFLEVLKRTGGATDKDGKKVQIKEFALLDFKPIFDYYFAKNEAKKARPAADKKADKAAKDAIEAPYVYCKWNGRKEKVGNFRVEPPGLFRGRGEHPKTGKVKTRVMPEQITINIGEGAQVPAPPEGHKWKEVKHDNSATWLAMWQENINGAYKYVMLAANSTIKGQSDFKKFEKARELKKHIDRIRADYMKDMKSDMMADRQRATAVYLIDRFALRAGNEKDTENEAETVGCCSLKFEHVTLKPPNTVIFDFLGKDSIRFYDEVTVHEQVFKNLKIFKKNKNTGDDIFDRLTTGQLNKHLTNYMPGLSAKVFRTYNASWTMAKLLNELKATNASVQEKVKLYNDCNRKVAILCNHKRTVGASHEAQMEKIGDKIKGMKYQKWRLKQMILDLDPKQKKKRGAEWFELDSDIDETWVLEHHEFLVQTERTKIEKKFQKDNEKLLAQGEKEMKAKELSERLQTADELAAKLKKENKTKKVEAEGKGITVEKLEGQIQKMDDRIHAAELQAEDREGNKEVALGTSKINYIDPRLTVVFSKKFNVPIEKFFSKTLREKFNWAIKSVEDVDDWQF